MSVSPVVVAVGVFDGLHAGHRAVVSHAKAIADQINGSLTVASFDPSPKAFLWPDTFDGVLTTPHRRRELLLAAGADRVEFLKFDSQMANMSPDEFIDKIVIEQLGAHTVVVGHNFTFGHKAMGTVETLVELGKKFGIAVSVVPLRGDGQYWSSTRIRKAVLAGDVLLARELLGRPHRLSGEVVHGDHRGRELGYPTANMAVEGGLIIPCDGVYSGLATIGDVVAPAAISIGTNPTFEGVEGRRVEAFLIGQSELDLYGQTLTLDFIDHVREMTAFSGIDELLTAMAGDVVRASAQIHDFLDVKAH